MSQLLERLNRVQRQAVTTTDGPVLILAGAGSGKTRVVTYRIAHILSSGLAEPSEILALTFTNKAAAEMRERVSYLFGADIGGLWICTFHALGARLLRLHGDRLGLTPSFTIYDDDDSSRALKACVLEAGLDPTRMPPDAVKSWMARNKFSRVNPELADEDPGAGFLEARFVQVFELYMKRLRANNAVDFDDLLTLPARLFLDDEYLLERYRRRFRYIFVDEYQDTNRAQFHLCRLLAPPPDASICVVGDEDQSIYSWRGADIRNILEFEQHYPGAKAFHLVRNYRSTAPILEAAGRLIAYNTERRKTQELYTEVRGGEPVVYARHRDGRDEASYVAAQIERLSYSTERHGYGDIAVFYRVHAQSRQIEAELVRRHIPYRVVGGPRFYERKEIKDLLAYLRVFVNPLDQISLLRIINVPPRKLGAKSIERALEAATAMDLPLYAFLETGRGHGIGTAAARRFRELYEFLEGWRLRFEELDEAGSLAAMVRNFIDELGYVRFLARSGKEDRIDLVQEFVAAIADRAGPGAGSTTEDLPGSGPLAAFLAEVTLSTELDTPEGSTDGKVTLMTLHNAKGLEFPVVFVVGLDEGLLPYGNNAEEPGRLEEERRLCYVGFTRAMKKLFVTSAQRRFIWGRPVASVESRFVSEAGLSSPQPRCDWDYIPDEDFPDEEFADDFWDD